MSITATTLSTAIGSNATFFGVASATGITSPNFQTGTGITYLFVDQEFMLVTSLSGTVVTVARGQLGTAAAAHVSGAQVLAGLPSDFTAFQIATQTSQTSIDIVAAHVQPAIFLTGSADAISAVVPGYYVVKTAGVDAMTLAAPTAAQEGNIIDIWSDTTNAHTITATGLFAVGVSLKTTCTFPAFRGAGVTLRACNLVYHVIGAGGAGTNGGPVVWT